MKIIVDGQTAEVSGGVSQEEFDTVAEAVSDLDKAVNGDSAAVPPVTGLSAEVQNIKAELEGTEEQPGLDARVGELENTAIRDVTGNGNITVTIGEDKTATISTTDTLTTSALNVTKEQGVITLSSKLEMNEQTGKLSVVNKNNDLVPIQVGTPNENNDAANKAYVDAAVPDVSGLQSQITEVKATADGALQKSGGDVSGTIQLLNGSEIYHDTSGAVLDIGDLGSFSLPINHITSNSSGMNNIPTIGRTSNRGIPYIGFTSTVIPKGNRTRLQGIATPVNASDAVPKDYVDGLMASRMAAPTTSSLPGGFITMFLGTTELPDGWVLCDGTNGTPNLMDVMQTDFNGVDVYWAMKL